ncbi:dj-1/thij/pfpi family protein [Anaeramoeba flamelloides]|uniref:Dj-1/thij/pfpi family protein n=1 Tax=Anaeramoeba flamelloides TaxID=1746091 RepID=A0AAV7YF50_9EUKA|nr:dj-1/thij/pfpi family protein [Anaeramoeba flamelloides]|eukprot:Anaeramoba_flamelloidesa326381_2134.p1 GENE.a326381_2134~~a326381_2134.p1  ORF type:complete len:201 (+),score=32.44 a326381_2134:32-604(+)
MSKKLLMLCGDFMEDYETMVPFVALQCLGHKVIAVCKGKKSGETVKTSVHDFEGQQTYSEKVGHNFWLNGNFNEVLNELDSFDGLVIPGGRAPEYIRLEEEVITITKHFLENNKPIAVICHGPLVLVAAGGLKGRECSAYPACGPDVTLSGGKYIKVESGQSHVEGNIVSAPDWTCMVPWIQNYHKLLTK